MRISLTSLKLSEPLTSLKLSEYLTSLVLVLCIMTWMLSLCSARGLICMKCQNITNSGNCSNTTMCNDGEDCYAREIVRNDGSTILEADCLSHQVCTVLHSPIVTVGRRDETKAGKKHGRVVTNCNKCCTKDLCNEHICDVAVPTGPISTSPANSIVTTPTSSTLRSCYTCSDVTKFTDCTVISTCAAGQQCYTTRATLGGNTHYSMGCEDNQICPLYTSGSQSPFCKQCCDSDHCNIGLCGLHVLPELVIKPFNRTLEVEDVTKLRCEADNLSNATLTWTFESPTGSTVLPKPLTFGPRNTTAFFQITNNHFGEWTCTATNIFGSASASAFISHC
ncbi:uncharacterized protein LOC132553241 [Ylistrum balloti]|uniref:uncharacterized protein LOC132553241 n=1 Tax=Ylistrum balloti TaxID=509963 RepID=UPI002905BFBC|nr:uncharacterized protein LOC132553241 [Ylistrum balloti]